MLRLIEVEREVNDEPVNLATFVPSITITLSGVSSATKSETSDMSYHTYFVSASFFTGITSCMGTTPSVPDVTLPLITRVAVVTPGFEGLIRYSEGIPTVVPLTFKPGAYITGTFVPAPSTM